MKPVTCMSMDVTDKYRFPCQHNIGCPLTISKYQLVSYQNAHISFKQKKKWTSTHQRLQKCGRCHA